jgi:hypothetical protein
MAGLKFTPADFFQSYDASIKERAGEKVSQSAQNSRIQPF